MVGDPAARKPSTSNGPGPPFQAVAPKLRYDRPLLCTLSTVMPHAGNASMSGSVFGGGVMIGASAGDWFCGALSLDAVRRCRTVDEVVVRAFAVTIVETEASASEIPNASRYGWLTETVRR